jgi:hypothetical protein
MTQKILRTSVAWLAFCGLAIGLAVFPSSARGARASAKSTAQKNSASATSHKGMVWVNPKTKIYHREGDRWYGKSKGGKYMTEADAIKAGYRAAKPRHKLANEKPKK